MVWHIVLAIRMDLTTRIVAFLRAQLLSVCNTSTGIIASTLSSRVPPANFPIFLSFLNYSLLAICYFRPKREMIGENLNELRKIVTDYRRVEGSGDIASRLWSLRYPIYPFAALLDVEASILVLSAYQYTTITSVVLLDCFAIPCTMILSIIFLDARYATRHYFGTLLCLLGLFCNVFSDAYSGPDSNQSYPNSSLGDFLCLLAYFLYAISNVLQEYLVKYVDRKEFLGMLGFGGSIISFIEFLNSTELTLLGQFSDDVNFYLLIFGYVAFLFCFYVNASIVLQSNDATYFNLSLLTSDIYAFAVTYFFFGAQVKWLYFVSFGLVVAGVILYHSITSPTIQDSPDERVPESNGCRDSDYDRSLEEANGGTVMNPISINNS